MIGDCRTAALVGRDGSIDWLCLPRFDSPSCFTALLGEDEHGLWRIAPRADDVDVTREYVDGSLVLKTRFRTSTGVVEVTDFMPVTSEHSQVMRRIRGVAGRVAMVCKLVVRFGYGSAIPWVESEDLRTVTFVAGPDKLHLLSPIDLHSTDTETGGEFEIKEGQELAFVLQYARSFVELSPERDVNQALEETRSFWKDWSSKFESAGPWSEVARRSLVTLKGLTYAPTGGIVAAATTSLPELIGGERNWDYRYCWLRDSAFALLAFLNAGYTDEARDFRNWLLRAVAGSPEQIQIMYGIAGERKLTEEELPWLAGYEGSTPVRIGNAAAAQSQVDIYGELFDALALAIKGGLEPVGRSPKLRRVILEHLEQVWREPDSGIWEVRGPPQHFTLSKVMAWVAFDRAALNEHMTEDAGERAHYRSVADEIRADVCTRGLCTRRRCFTQAYGKEPMDAGLLLLAPVGFLPPEHEFIRNTVAEIEQRLLSNGLVMRYETETGVDGLPPGEGAFIACSFWLVDNFILQGRLEAAEALFDRVASLRNDVGLLAEEYDPVARRLLGNFPQAFSHVALVNSAFALARATKSEPKAASVPEREP